MVEPARFDILLVSPRGFCAGVERAIDIVDLVLQERGAPLWVRKEIVHNKHVVRRFEERGVHFVDELDEVPDGATCIFSAHGVSPAVWEAARERGLTVIDATCPLVTKVHRQVKRSARQGYSIVLVGHAGHEEVEGTMGQAPDRTYLVESEADVAALEVPGDQPLYYATQTTLSLDETRGIIRALRERFPDIEGPHTEDICYATTNRQDAVKKLADDEGIDLLLVVGSTNSSNSQRLVETARERGCAGYLVDSADDADPAWLEGALRVGVSAGASAPDDLVQGLVAWLEEHGGRRRELQVADEDVLFPLPPELREAGRRRAAQRAGTPGPTGA